VLGEKGIAPAVAAVVIAALIGGAGVPVYVDSNFDQQPDEPLYALERAGESIKETAVNAGLYGNKLDWQIDRCDERRKEFENMAAENKARRYMGLLRRANKRMRNACGCVENREGLDRAENAAEKHLEVLKRVRKKVPENARWGINNAIRNARRYKEGLERARKAVEKRRGPPGKIREIIEEKLKEAKRRRGK